MDNALTDETNVRMLLDRVAADDEPPSGIDVGIAMQEGRRRRRRLRVYLPGVAPLAAAAAVALIAGITTAVSGTGLPVSKPQASRGAQTTPITAPSRFSVLTPFASFGWLPTAFSTAGLANQAYQSTSELRVTATAPAWDARELMLQVDAAGYCRLSGPTVLTNQGAKYTFPHALTCGNVGGGQPLSGPAPDVNGRSAYWTALHGSLVWQYGRDAWATLTPMPNPSICVHCAPHPALTGWYDLAAKNGHPAVRQSAAARTLLVKIASAVRFGTKPVVLYGFTLHGLPPSWRPGRVGGSSSFARLDGRLVSSGWAAGPAADPTALSIAVWPAVAGSSPCNRYEGQTEYVTIGGVPMLLRTISQPYEHAQYLCAEDAGGLRLSISLDKSLPGTKAAPVPGVEQVGGVSAIAIRLRLLGADLSRWTPRQP